VSRDKQVTANCKTGVRHIAFTLLIQHHKVAWRGGASFWARGMVYRVARGVGLDAGRRASYEVVCGLCWKYGVSASHTGQRMLTPSTRNRSLSWILYPQAGQVCVG
jgi:hypothetical protein